MDPRHRPVLRRRLGVFRGLTWCLVALLVLIYAWLQLVRHSEFKSLAMQQAVKVRPIPAPRGLVLDRNGHRLVDNRRALHLVVQREDLPTKPEVIASLAAALELDPAALTRKIQSYRFAGKGRPLVLKENLDEAGIAIAERIRARYPFLSVEVAPRRVYLGDELAGHVLGYVGEVDELMMKVKPDLYRLGETIGKEGFEASGNDKLKGVDGQKRILVDQLGTEVANFGQNDAVTGRSLFLTLDAGLQKVAQDAMGEESGAVVVLDLRDGGVLALYSSPSYDPNLFLNRLSQDMVDRYLANSVTRPMVNRATQGIYAPGSTFKLLVALAALERGIISPQTPIYCAGKKNFYGRDYRCDKPTGHGSLSMIQAIAQSCDVYFYELASRMDVDDIYATAEKYGLTERTGIDLPQEKRTRIPSREWKRAARPKDPKWFAGETISVGIGQGAVGVTPIGLARFYALLATKGKLLTPHLFYGFRDDQKNSLEPAPVPPMKDTPLDEKHWAILDEGLREVVLNGTAAANPFIREIAKGTPFSGKTGTAQVATFVDKAHYARQAKKLKDHALFAGYAPQEHPQIAFAVVVENAGFGSTAAAPVAAKLVKYWFADRLSNPIPPPRGKMVDPFAPQQTQPQEAPE
ncbi:penicillin-binding protein 2 [Geothrix sp. PMB-07]|uniref:penicillin-binding protein 2 n=1 Tax=Geothrix sp. PMB-07 TaxID=3068640 RepID=UPI002741BDBD|nr:penicillin-binding protein 2 [Geothrix sp. PMB-07]WLT31953.1 penicillin-binding protein 2 [Geothrix sp. PMB-07]